MPPAECYAPRYWGTWFGLGLLWLLSRLPHRPRRALGHWLGRRTFGRNRKRRAIVMTNLGWALPELAEQHTAIADAYFGYVGQMVVETGFFWWGSRQRLQAQMAIEGIEHIDNANRQGRSVIVTTAHHLPVDFGPLMISDHVERGFFMANRARNRLIDWFTTRRRGRFGGVGVMRDESLRRLLRPLKQGAEALQVLYMVIDEDLGLSGTTFAPFFGVEKATLLTPIKLAEMTGAAIVYVVTWFDDEANRYRMRITPIELPEGDERAKATSLNRAIETGIHLAPAQFMWSLRLFQTRPDGSPPPYTMKGKPGSGPRPRPE